MGVKGFANGFVAEKWTTFFCGKNEVDVNGGERLGHEEKIVNQGTYSNPKRTVSQSLRLVWKGG